jgi:hypothetical protein
MTSFPESILDTIAEEFRVVDAIDAVELVTGKSWEDDDIVALLAPHLETGNIPDAVIFQLRDSLATFSPLGFRYILPHYLKYAVRNPDTEVCDNLVYRLADRKAGDVYWDSRVALLTQRQEQTVCMVLRGLSRIGNYAIAASLDEAISAWCSAKSGKVNMPTVSP